MTPLDETNKKSRYINEWKRLFGVFLGWSSERVMQWVDERYASYLDTPDDIFYHKDPVYWAIPTLVPDMLRTKLNNLDLIDLQHKILLAFLDEHHHYFPSDTDFRPYRDKVEQILNLYGAHLPAVDADNSDISFC